jgi:hypothetical protein
MAGGGFIAAVAGVAAAVGVVMASDVGPKGGEATAPVGGAARVTGAAPERHRPSCQDENASVRINVPTTRPHKSIRLFTSTPLKRPQR